MRFVLSSPFEALSITETTSDGDEKRGKGISSEVLVGKMEAATMRVHYSDRHYKNILKVQHCDSVSYNTVGDSYSLQLFPIIQGSCITGLDSHIAFHIPVFI